MNGFNRSRAWLVALGITTAILLSSGPAAAQAPDAASADFGQPPSGEVPILFNDRHVYATPDRLRDNRVLAALVKGGTILVPLRSLFEQMGASVAYDAATKTVVVSKTGAEVKVTVGKSVVTIDGEDRPLDVAPEIYKGAVVVPLRVLSEGMGAYVQWVPDKRLVVVRYIPAPPPTAAPTVAPTVAPTAPPTVAPTSAPTATPLGYEKYVQGDYQISPVVYNELSPGNRGNASYDVKGGVEFPLIGARMLLDASYGHLKYAHNSNFGYLGCAPGSAGCNTVVGSDPNYRLGPCPTGDPGCVTTVGFQRVVAYNGLGQAYVPAFQAYEQDLDAHLSIKLVDPRIYVGVGGYFKQHEYLGYPNLSGFGFGLTKAPDFENPFSFYGSVWYYPSVSGNYTYPTSTFLGPLSGQVIQLSYSVLKYDVGANVNFGKSPLYLSLGYNGSRFNAKNNAPSDAQISSPFVGLGLHF